MKSTHLRRPTIPLVVALVVAAVMFVDPAPVSAVESANNDFANATVIGSLPFEFGQSVVDDDREVDEPDASCDIASSSTATVWFKYPPTADTTIAVDTGPGYAFAYFGVYTGATLATLSEYACSRESVESFSVSNGTDYWFQVGSYPGASEALWPKFRLGKPATLTGTVEDGVGAPIEGIFLRAYADGQSGQSGGGTVSVVDGTFLFELVEGDWNLEALDTLEIPVHSNEWYADVLDQTSAATITLPPDGSNDVTMTLGLAATVNGAISDSFTGDPISSTATAYLVSDPGVTFSSDTTAGTYSITGIYPGTYAVATNSDGGGVYRSEWSDGTEFDIGQIGSAPLFVLGAGTTTSDVDFLLTAGGFSGTVIDSKSGEPTEGVRVDLHQNVGSGNVLATTLTGASGDFRLVGADLEDPESVEFVHPGGLYVTEWYNDQTDPNNAASVGQTGVMVLGFDADLAPINVAPVAEDIGFNISEEAANGTTVGILPATDANQADALSYGINAGNGAGLFSIDATTGELTVAGPLDYETTQEHVLTIEVGDDNGPSLTDTATVTVTVTDEWERVVFGFVDVPDDHLFADDINWMAWKQITLGCNTAPSFCPDGTVIRAHMASFLANALALPEATADYFTDDEGSAHEDNINRLREAGVTLGCNAGGTLFCPDAIVTREQMATFLANALGLEESDSNAFTDDDSSIHERNINALSDSGITQGL